jgi:hypothetical protein
MADDYASFALSQRAAFEAAQPDVLAAAEEFADEPVLCIADLGAADGVNSYGLIRELITQRAGRPLVYALVDLPTNGWHVAAEHLQSGLPGVDPGTAIALVPDAGDASAADVGTGTHYASAETHAEACRRALARRPPPAVVLSLAGIALDVGPCLPAGTVHIAVSGTAMHWVADVAGLPSTGSVFPGYRDHADEGERQAWQSAAARQWERLLHNRSTELVPGGRLIVSLPASSAPWPDGISLYTAMIAEMNDLLADWSRAGRIRAETAAAVVTPVWMRTLEEIRAPFDTGGGQFADLVLEKLELVRLDNPYWHPDPARFARAYVRSVTAWGGPLFLRAFSQEGPDKGPALLAEFMDELQQRVVRDPERYRWDYLEALVVCRKVNPEEPAPR